MKISKYVLLFCITYAMTAFTNVDDWYVYDSKNFKVSFPKKPVEEIKLMKTDIGEVEVKTLTCVAQSPSEKNLKFYVSSNKIPKSTEEGLTLTEQKVMFDSAINGSLRNHKATLISDKSIKLFEYAGREVRMSMKEGQIIATMRAYVVEDNYYGLIVYTFKENDLNDEIDTFFKSFAVKITRKG